MCCHWSLCEVPLPKSLQACLGLNQRCSKAVCRLGQKCWTIMAGSVQLRLEQDMPICCAKLKEGVGQAAWMLLMYNKATASRRCGQCSSIAVQAGSPTAPPLMCRALRSRSPCGRRRPTSGLAAWSRGR